MLAYAEAVQRQPTSATAVAGLMRAYGERGRWDAAFAAADTLRARVPDDPGVLYQVRRAAAISRRRLADGEHALRRYLERAAPAGLPGLPSRASAHWRVGMIREARGDRSAVHRAYEAALRLEPQNGAARRCVGWVSMDRDHRVNRDRHFSCSSGRRGSALTGSRT